MRSGAYKAAAATSNGTRRSLVGEKWSGLNQRINARGERVLEFDYYDETGRRRYGVAHGALAMTTPGDTSMTTLDEVERVMRGGGARVVR